MTRLLSICIALFLFVSVQAQEAAPEIMIVVQKRADSVGFYDVATGKSLATVMVGRKPHEMMLSPDEKLLYITNYGVDSYTATEPGGDSISILDVVAKQKISDIQLGSFHRPHGIALGRSGKLYVTADLPASLLVIDPKKKAIVRHFAVEQQLPHMVVVTPDEQKAYIANSGSASVTALSLRDGKIIRHIPIGGVPMGPALSADGRRLFVGNRSGNAVVVIDTTRNEVVGSIEIQGQPARLKFTPDNKRLLVSLMESGDVAVVDVAALKVIHRFHVGNNPEGLNIDPAGRQGYVSAQGENKVVRFSLTDWTPDFEIKTDNRPDPMVIVRARRSARGK